LRAHFFAAGKPDQLERQPRAPARLLRWGTRGATEIFWSQGTNREDRWIGTPVDSQFWSRSAATIVSTVAPDLIVTFGRIR